MYGFHFLCSNFFLFLFSKSFSLEVRLSFLRFNTCIQSFFVNLKIRALQALLVLEINQIKNQASRRFRFPKSTWSHAPQLPKPASCMQPVFPPVIKSNIHQSSSLYPRGINTSMWQTPMEVGSSALNRAQATTSYL